MTSSLAFPLLLSFLLFSTSQKQVPDDNTFMLKKLDHILISYTPLFFFIVLVWKVYIPKYHRVSSTVDS